MKKQNYETSKMCWTFDVYNDDISIFSYLFENIVLCCLKMENDTLCFYLTFWIFIFVDIYLYN